MSRRNGNKVGFVVQTQQGLPPTEGEQTYSGRVLRAIVQEIDEHNKVLRMVLAIRTPHVYRGFAVPHALILTSEDNDERKNTVEQLTAAGIQEHQITNGQLTHALEGRTLRFKYDPEAKEASRGVVITECAYVKQGHI